MARRHIYYHHNKHVLQTRFAEIIAKADAVLEAEHVLIEDLLDVDRVRLYRYLGYRSMRTFCMGALRFSKNQSQRLVTEVRRRNWQLDEEERRASGRGEVAVVDGDGDGARQLENADSVREESIYPNPVTEAAELEDLENYRPFNEHDRAKYPESYLLRERVQSHERMETCESAETFQGAKSPSSVCVERAEVGDINEDTS